MKSWPSSDPFANPITNRIGQEYFMQNFRAVSLRLPYRGVDISIDPVYGRWPKERRALGKGFNAIELLV
jgi:hypothetical protein